MSYQTALEATGVVVKEFKEFGSYQGTWIALLTDGRIVEGSYGSCSGCDAYQSEFGYFDSPREDDGKYYKGYEDEEITKEQYDDQIAEGQLKLRNFGQDYLNGATTLTEITERYLRKSTEEYAWEDDREIYEWLKSL